MPTPLELERSTIVGATPRRRYARPPIIEALVDIQVEPGGQAGVLELGHALHDEAERFPTRQELFESSVTINLLTGESNPPASREVTGYRFVSADGQQAVRFGRTGFTFSRLPPYGEWEDWRGEARRLWDRYRRLAGPSAVTRIAVRYINRVDIPQPWGDISEYFNVRPELPSGLPPVVDAFLMQLQVAQPDMPGTTMILNQGRVEAPRPDLLSILLDVDVFRTVRLPAESAEFWEGLEQLHGRANTVFEACITNRTREIFD